MGWLLVALCTASGHFLSLHKANVKAPVPVFRYLGYEFDCPKLEIRLPEKRKIKMRNLLHGMLAKPRLEFQDLEKFRGMAISLALICPLALLYIREMTRVLTTAGQRLQFDFETDFLLREELNSWDTENFLIDARRNFGQVQEKDIVMGSMVDYTPEHMSGNT